MSEPKKRTLRWQEEDVLWSGSMELSITVAIGEKGYKLCSLLLGRIDGSGERTSNFFRPEDIDDAIKVLLEAQQIFKTGGPK